MINYKIGNLLDSNTEALVNTVNTVGIMGKGIALQFKNRFPENYKKYKKACKNHEVKVGQLFITEENTLLHGNKIIINFPTKTSWQKPSEYIYIEKGLQALAKIINEKQIKSIAIPPLGAGNGGLNWNKIKILLNKYLSNLNCEIIIYEPSSDIKEVLKKERVKLTPARAMLLSILYDLVRNNEFVSEFAAEKISYFLQRFGAHNEFNLIFKPNFYGPYSGKVKHVLYYLNGSFIMGYSSKDKKPFEELHLVVEAERDVINFLEEIENYKYKLIVDKTKNFLGGFYSPFGLELLSTIDYIQVNKKTKKLEDITYELENWSHRKKTLFTKTKFIQIALNNINNNLALSQNF